VHTYASGNADDISAIQNRPDRVQALLDNRQDNQCQSRPPQSDAPRKRRTRVAETKPLSQITWPRNVAHQSPEDIAAGLVPVRTFSTSLKARGARRAPSGA
jgi:hypothetical protein